MTRFAEMGFARKLTPCSATPEIDGYHVERHGLPWHVHPEATPEEWAALIEARRARRLVIARWRPAPRDPAAALAALRERRNRLLADSDWTQLADAPLDEDSRAQWTKYRAALRELPRVFAGSPYKAVFPESPA